MIPITSISIGQYTTAGRKKRNQDACGFICQDQYKTDLKGSIAAIADGVSTSQVSQEASQLAINQLLKHYSKTPPSWSVERSVRQVLGLINQKLFVRNDYDRFQGQLDQAYICTLSGLVLLANQAYVFHIGDSRIYRIRNQVFEQLTTDHTVMVSGKNYLAEALGFKAKLTLDFCQYQLQPGDLYILATDGFFNYVDADNLIAIDDNKEPLGIIAQRLVSKALAAGSDDNITIQLIRVNTLVSTQHNRLDDMAPLAIKSCLRVGESIDKFKVVEVVHQGCRSHVYKVVSPSNEKLILKMPNFEMATNQVFIDRLLMEEWMASLVSSQHVIKPPRTNYIKSAVYSLASYIDGITLAVWLEQNPNRTWQQISAIIEQVAKGLLALHRKKMLHQDIRLENIMIDASGLVKIIDLGSVYIEGIESAYYNTRFESMQSDQMFLGEVAFMAPEILLGHASSVQSDLFSLAAVTYYLITEELPYGTKLAQLKSLRAQKRCAFRPIDLEKTTIPFWLNTTLAKALDVQPEKRYDTLSAFLFDLATPNQHLLNQQKPIMQRNPVRFWQSVSALFVIVGLILLFQLLTPR